MSNYYLVHHGIKGQQWGVRNGPPYPIEDKVLKKGTRLNSVSSKHIDSDAYKKTGRDLYTYRADEEWDNKVYKGPFSKYLVMYRGARFIAEHKYETIADLRMPTQKERKDAFKELLDEKNFLKKAAFLNDLEKGRNMLVVNKVGSPKEIESYKNFKTSNIKTKEQLDVAYSIFNHLMEASNQFSITRQYMNTMRSRYDAMVDDNNQGVYNKAHDPIIIFEADKYLKSLHNEKRYLSYNEIIDNYNAVKEELAKEGINTKL